MQVPPPISSRFSLIAFASLSLAGLTLEAQTELPDQSPARPFGLGITGTVMQAGSDADAADFQANTLPSLQSFINQALGERQELGSVDGMALDPSMLRLETDSNVRVYFVSEGAGYHNTLGYNTDGTGVDEGSPLLIFPDASSSNSTFSDGDTTLGGRSEWVPLLPGDFVDLGNVSAGSQLDFFLIANGVRGGQNVFTADDAVNPDGIQHVVAFALEGSPYLLIGFEDLLNGGDRDFNDLLFAVDFGAANVDAVIRLASPEPSMALLLGVTLSIVLLPRRRPSPRLAAKF